MRDGFLRDEQAQELTYTKTFTDVKSGTYRVIEKNTAVKGYDLVTGEGSATVLEGRATVETGKKAGTEGFGATADLVDEYKKAVGDLVIRKTIKGGVTEEEFDGALTFQVYREETTGEGEGAVTKKYYLDAS